jgi:hypothetical protein
MNPWGVLTSTDFWIGYSIGFILATIITTIWDYMANPYIDIIIRTRGSLSEVAGRIEEALRRVTETVYREEKGDVIIYKPMINYMNEVRVYEGVDGAIWILILGFEKRRIARAIRRALKP